MLTIPLNVRAGFDLARVMVALMSTFVGAGCANIQNLSHQERFSAGGLIGIHHMSSDFNIMNFYVDDYPGGNVGREGYGGHVCCVNVPWKWRPGLQV